MKYRKILAIVGIMSLLVCGCGKSSDENKVTPLPQNSSESEASTDLDTESEAESEPVSEAKEYEQITSDAEIKDYGSLAVIGDAGFELYNYSEKTGEAYAKAVSGFADEMDGVASVYDVIIPLGSGIVFPDNKEAAVTGQRDAMVDIFGKMSDKVNKVDIYDSLMSHRTEYIYFRTDHHWTALGAYYAYASLCESMGTEVSALDSYETVDFDGFVGSFYNDSKDQALKDNPDTIKAYKPHAKDTATLVSPGDGKDDYNWNIIYDVSSYPAGVKYSTFIAGDNPFTVITNNEKTDGSSCVVVKESFGNAFVPFLVDNYQTVYVVDYRYWEGSLKDLVKEKGAKDVIFLNNLSMLRNKYLVGQFQGIVK